jgi:sugar lactone lactonase YvrE
MLANNSFRLRNKLFDSRAKNSVDFTMKTPFGRFLVVGLGLLASGLYASAPLPVITSQPTNELVVSGGTAVFSVAATNPTPPYTALTYQWLLNGKKLPASLITTVAGGNLFNNQPATNVILNSAMGVAADALGNCFIADTGNHVIRKVGTNGVAVIVAGTGSAGFSGDGGAATNAALCVPNAVALDLAGNLFIADTGNNRIRELATNGVITMVAGNGNVFYSGDNGAATNAGLTSYGLCLDGIGNLFIVDEQNNRIRKVGTNGIITTVAGNGGFGFGQGGYNSDGISATSAKLNYPSGVAVDSSNNLYIADSSNNRIRKVDGYGLIHTVAGTGIAGYSGDGGVATSAKINYPAGVALGAAGNLLIADANNNCVRSVTTNNIITTVAGNGTNGYAGDGGSATNANMFAPQNVSMDQVGNLFIADTGNQRIREVGTNGVITTVAGSVLNDGGLATNATLNQANGVAVDSVGNVYVADTYNNRIRKIDTNGIITTVAGNGVLGFAGDGGLATNANLRYPHGVALDATGDLFVADSFNRRIREVDTNGFIWTVAGNGSFNTSGDGGQATNAGIMSPQAVTVDQTGNLFIVDIFNANIRKVGTNGVISSLTGIGLAEPTAVTLDSAGNLFIADMNNNRVRKVAVNGTVSTVAGSGIVTNITGDGGLATSASVGYPSGVAVDSTGNLYIADNNFHTIRKVTNGIISTVAGIGKAGFGGDGGVGTNAALDFPQELAVDSAGNVYISDNGNNRIRKFIPNYANLPTLTLANVTMGSLSNKYSVIITGAYGSTTSSTATLIVALPGYNQIANQLLGDGTMQLAFVGIAGGNYALDSSFSLSPANWLPQATNRADAFGNLIFTNPPDPATNDFWRIRSVP